MEHNNHHDHHSHHDHAHHHDHNHDFGEHAHSMWDELIHHIPYAVFSVAFCLVLLSFFSCSSIVPNADVKTLCKQAHTLFHSFHFMHIVFAATGTIITFFRFSRSLVVGILAGIICPAIFCTLSDSILPYLGGRMLGVDMHFHLCFLKEFKTVSIFLAAGIINGFVMSKHHISRQGFYSVFSHFFHILISALASTFFLISHGYVTWYKQIGPVFIFLIFAVVVPCTFADVVVPMTVAKWSKPVTQMLAKLRSRMSYWFTSK